MGTRWCKHLCTMAAVFNHSLSSILSHLRDLWPWEMRSNFFKPSTAFPSKFWTSCTFFIFDLDVFPQTVQQLKSLLKMHFRMLMDRRGKLRKSWGTPQKFSLVKIFNSEFSQHQRDISKRSWFNALLASVTSPGGRDKKTLCRPRNLKICSA